MNRVRFYRRFKNWRWTVKSVNGRKIGASSEGYKNKSDAIYNFQELTGRALREGYAEGRLDRWVVTGL